MRAAMSSAVSTDNATEVNVGLQVAHEVKWGNDVDVAECEGILVQQVAGILREAVDRLSMRMTS
jgi:hypothetical protein